VFEEEKGDEGGENVEMYIRKMKALQKEFDILKNEKQALQDKYTEQKENMAELKTEAREGVQQIIMLEG